MVRTSCRKDIFRMRFCILRRGALRYLPTVGDRGWVRFAGFQVAPLKRQMTLADQEFIEQVRKELDDWTAKDELH